jgi:hypothetical protein
MTLIQRVSGRRAEFAPDGPFDPEQPFEVGKMKFDSRDGIGAVGNNANVNYMGFVVWMPVEDFLHLNPRRKGFEFDRARDGVSTKQFMLDAAEAGETFGPPILYLQAELAYDKETITHWDVTGHEGRGRATTLQALEGPRAILPVHVKPSARHQGTNWREPGFHIELRAHHLTPEGILGTCIHPDLRAGLAWGRLHYIRRITWKKKNYRI